MVPRLSAVSALPVRARLLGAFLLLYGAVNLPFLTGRKVYAVGDTLGFNYPALRALTPFSLDGFLSDPFTGMGFPWLVTYGTLDPVAHALRLFLSPEVTLAWLCFLYFAVGAWLFSLLLLRKGCGAPAAFAGAAVYSAGFFWTGDGDYPLAFSVPLLAGLLLAVDGAHARPVRAGLACSLAVAYGWLAGHFNFVPIILTGTFAYACFLALHAAGDIRFRLRPVAALLTGVAVGSAAGAVKLVPALAYLQLSERAGGLSYLASSAAGTAKLSYLWTALFPFLRLPLLPAETGTFFFGAAGWAAVLAGGAVAWQRSRALLLAFLLCIAVALPHSPLYWALYHLPLFSVLRAPTRWLLLAYACAGGLAALGTAALLHHPSSRSVARIGRLLLGVGIVAAGAGVFVSVLDAAAGERVVAALQRYFDAHLAGRTSGLPAEHYHRHIAFLWGQLVANLHPLSLRFGLPLGALLATATVLLRPALPARRAWLAALLVGGLFPLFPLHHPRGAAAMVAAVRSLYAASPVGEGRVMPLLPAFADFLERTSVRGDDPEERLAAQLGLLVPNTHALLGVRSVDFYQPLQPTRMARLLAAVGSDSAPAPPQERLALAGGSLEERLTTIVGRMALLNMLGVGHVASAWPLPSPFRLAAEVLPADGLQPVRLYAVPGARPLAYIEPRPEVREPNEERAVALLREGAVRGSLIECGACAAQSGGGRVRVTSSGALRLGLEAVMEADGWLVVNHPRLPGWRVTVDGAEVPTAIANGIFFGIPLSQGNHEVRLAVTFTSLWQDSLHRLRTGADRWLL